MSIKIGRNNIQLLMREVIEKYKKDTGEDFNATQTPSNYASLAKRLSERTKELNERDSDTFPDLEYTITGAQIRNAYYAQVDYIKDYFYEACYLYLYNKLSSECKKERDEAAEKREQRVEPPNKCEEPYEQGEKHEEPTALALRYKKRYQFLLIASTVMLTGLFFTVFRWYNTEKEFETIKKDMHILPYKPTQAEIDRVEGVWEVYTGSPQVRLSGDHGYHKTVSNVMDITYKNGYFTFRRAGPTFSQLGYIQFEAPDLISIHSYYNNDTAVAVSPKHSLMKLEQGKRYLNAISASWSFDPKPADDIIIGIREVFTKLGKGGSVKIIRDSRENALFPGMGIVHWIHDNKNIDTLFQKIELLDSLSPAIQKLVDRNSILLKDPDSTRQPSAKGEVAGVGG